MEGQIIAKYQEQKTQFDVLKVIRNLEIILFLYCGAKCPTKAEKIEYAKMSYYWLWLTNWNQMQQNLHSFTIIANIWENGRNKSERHK